MEQIKNHGLIVLKKTIFSLTIPIDFIVFFYMSCKERIAEKKSSTFTIDNPSQKYGLKNKHIPLVLESLGLEPIKKGYDSLQVRLWRYIPSTDTGYLLILKQGNEVNYAHLYSFIYNFSDDSSSLASTNQKVVPLHPNLDWSIFIDSMFKLGLLTIPDFRGEGNYDLNMDADEVTLEVATKNYYKKIVIPQPEKNITKTIGAKKLMDIIFFLESELKNRNNLNLEFL